MNKRSSRSHAIYTITV